MSDRLQAASAKKRKAIEARESRRRFGLMASVFAVVVVGVALMVPVAGLLALVKYYRQPEAAFEVPPKEIRIPPKTPEHRMNVARHEASRPKPTFPQKLMSTRPTEFALPDLPQVDVDQMLPLDPSDLISDQVSGLIGSSGLGSGLGSGMFGAGGSGDGMGFLGIRTEGDRIVLLFDVSLSVVNKAAKTGIPFSKIREETVELIQGLPVNSRFGLIQFTRNFKPFRDDLSVATPGNKKEALDWLEREWNESGSIYRSEPNVKTPLPNGIEAVLKFAFAMDPDTIFLISDASFQRNPDDITVPIDEIGVLIRDLQKEASAIGGVTIHFIGFGVDEDDARDLKRIVRRNRGEFKEIEE